MESFTFKERLRRWNNPGTALEDSVCATARATAKQDEEASSPCHNEEKQLIFDRHALKELTFQMTTEGKQLAVHLDSLHETFSKETLECEHREALSADVHKRTCGIGKEVRALGRRVEELQQLLRQAKDNSNVAQEHGREVKDVNLAKPTDQLSLEELKARLEILETEKREMIEEKKDCKREVQFLKCQLQYREEMKALQESSDLVKLEEDNALLSKENHDLREKLDSFTEVTREHGLIADHEELSMLFSNSPSREHRGSTNSGLQSELEILRKERKILLATILKQQAVEKASSLKSNESVNFDVGQTDVLVGSERDELRKKVEGLHAQMEDLEMENKTLDDENTKLIEEQRELEDQVNKLKTQIADAIESNFDEIEQLNESNEDLHERFDVLQGQNKRLRQASNEFKEKCASHFEAALAEIEEKQSYEDVLVYMTDAIDHLLEFDDEATAATASEVQDAPSRASAERTRSSDLLEEIKVCKDVIENLRQQIRQIQFDKRDLEEYLTKMKREVMILKSKKRQEKRQEFQVVKAESQSDSNVAEEGCCNDDPTQQNEAIQQEIRHLKSRQSELEKLARTLKEDNCKLDNEKFCLLGSFYHLLERNEALEEQVANMKQHNVISMDKTKECLKEKGKPFDEGDLTRPTQPKIQPDDSQEDLTVDEGVNDAFTADLKCEIQRIGDKLWDVQEFLIDAEGEKNNLKDELGESKKNEQEFRTVVLQLNQELTVLEGRVDNVQELNDTLHDCLRDVHDEKRELIDSLGESNEDKVALERSLADMEDQMNNLQREIDALQNALGKIDKASQHLKIMCEKLSKLCTVLAKEETSPGQTNNEEHKENEIEPDVEELCSRSSLALDQVVEETERIRTEWKRYKLDGEKLKSCVDALSIEKQALQKYVRELDERKRQMKLFITRLTAEKETLAEEVDEIKQQKVNLAEALENVYRSKEGVQSKLDEAILKVEQLKASLRQSAHESKTLRESLCRVVKERDVVSVALLAEKQQLGRLRESEEKWRELAMGSHTEADQIIEVDRAIKEEMVNGRLKDEERQTIIQLKAERDELLKRIDSILTTNKMSDDDVTRGRGMKGETTENDQETDCACVEEVQLDLEHVSDSLQKGEERERADATSIKAEHLAPSQNAAEFGDKDDVPIHANAGTYEKWREENETMAEMLKQSTEENEQLRNWLDAVFVEKGRLEQELENTSEENKDLIRDLQRSSEDKGKLTLLLQKLPGAEKERQSDRQLDESGIREDKNEQQKQNLDTADWSAKQHELEELHDSGKESSDSLEQTVKELTDKCAVVETDLDRAQEDIRCLTNQISIIRREKGEYVASFEKAMESNRVLDKKYKQLTEDNQCLKDLNKESVRQADVLRLKNGELYESNKSVTDDLRNSRKTLEKTLQNAQQLRKEIKSLSANNQGLKRDIERAKEQESELEGKLTVAQQANDAMTVSVSVLTAAKEARDATCQQLADDLEDLRATVKTKVKIEENLQTLKKCTSDLMTKQEKLLLLEEGLKNLISESEEEAIVAEESRPGKEVILQDPLDQLKIVKQTLERRAEETKELEQSRKLVKSLQKELEDTSKQLRKSKNENEHLNLCMSKLDKEKSNRQNVLKELENKNVALEKQVKEIEKKGVKLQEENRELVAQKREQETSLKEISEEKSSVEKKLKEQAECNKFTLSKFEETRKALNKSQEERKDLKACVASLDKDKRTLQKQLKDIKAKLEKVQKEQDSSVKRSINEQLRITNLDSRIKEMDAEVRRATDEKKRLEKELTCEKSISTDLRLRVDEENQDKDELEEILEQRRNNYKNLKDELEKTTGKLNSAFAKLEKAEDELRGKMSHSEERDAKLKQSEEERKALRRKLDETTEKVSAVRMRLKRRTSDGNADNIGTEMKGNEGEEISQLEKEVSTVAQKNEDPLSECLDEANTKISVLEKKVQQLREERDDNKERLERSQQASRRLDVALECAKEDENRLRMELEESKYREGDLETRLQEIIEQTEHFSPPCLSAVQQEESPLERVLVTCAKVPEPSQVDKNVNSAGAEDADNATLLESQVRELRTELRKAKDQVFDFQQGLSDGKRALRQKERLHQQERTRRFQREIEEIEGECDELRKELSSLGAVEARRSSFSTVMDLKGTLRKAETDMWDVISKISRLLERAKHEVKEVTVREEDESTTPRTDLHSNKTDGETEVEDLAKQKDHLQKRVIRDEGTNEMLKQTLGGDTIAEREKKLEELLFRSQCENAPKMNVKYEVQELDGNNELLDRLRQSEAHVQENGELRFDLKKEVLEANSVLKNERKLERDDGVQTRDENPKRSTVLDVTLQKAQEAMHMLQTEKEALDAQCTLLQGKVKQLAEGKNQLLEDALSFKVKYMKKNQELASVLHTKEHDIISLQTKNEDLTSLVQKIEDDLLKSETAMEALRSQSRAVKFEKERNGRTCEEQQFELENLRKIRSHHDELNATLGHLSSEINELEDRNKALLEEKTQMAQVHAVEKADLLQERDAMVSRLREIEEENKLECCLKEVREDNLREKEQKLNEKSASIKKEKENLGHVTTKIQQMRGEYTQLESEYNILLESSNETSNENTILKKENSLIRKACNQLKKRKSLAEEKILEDVNKLVQVELEHKPERAIIRENVIPLHRATQAKDDFPFISDDKAFKRHSIAHSTRDHSEGLLIPISLSVQRMTIQPDTFVDRRRASSLPMEQGAKTRQGGTGVKLAPHNAPLLASSPAFSSDSAASSRSSEVDSSVCPRRHYCSPILSVVDLCPLHHGSPSERKPSPCLVCRKRERRNPTEFVSSEKYV